MPGEAIPGEAIPSGAIPGEAVSGGPCAAPGSARRIAPIDGLRAVAVLAVLLYHAGFALLPGGLAGVDIFFTISGFVVSRSLLADGGGDGDGDGAKARLALFYARRLRRIVPALVAMLVAATLAYCLFVPDAWLSNIILRTDLTAFVGLSNVVLGATGDTYFSPLATLNPFTHSWSLGIEEQFYLLLPALLILSGATRRQRPKRGIVPIAGLALASLAICAGVPADQRLFAFYSIVTRFWELAAGVLLCLAEAGWRPRLRRLPARLADVLVVAAGIAVLIALATPPGRYFPWPIALPCVLGTAAIVAVAAARPAAPALLPLRLAPVLAIGRASYSIYLWHWPLIVLMRWTVGIDDPRQQAAAVALSLALGFASYRLVERPAARAGWLAAGGSATRIGRMLLLLAAGALVAEALLLAKKRISLSRTADAATWYAGRGDRHLGPPAAHPVTIAVDSVAGGIVRRFAPSAPAATLFMIGDSHSLVYLPDARRLAEDEGWAARAYFAYNCSFLPLNEPMRGWTRCPAAFYRHALAEIAATGRPGDVLFLPDLRLPRFVDQWGPAPSGWSDPALRAAETVAAIRLLKPIADRGVAILFESPTPVFRSIPFRCSDWFNRGNPVCAAGFTMPRAELDALRAAPLAQMRTIAARLPGVRIWNAFDLLCPGRRCSAFRGDKPLFLDGDHLSGYGAGFVYPGWKAAVLAAGEAQSQPISVSP